MIATATLLLVCQGCHLEIVRTYRQTGMGRSFAPVESAPALERFYHPASDRHYQVVQREGKWFLRRHQGRGANVVEKQIHYVIGSGNHARTYLHRGEDGRMVQLPVTWYAAKGGYWEMSPGYDRPDHDDFRRRVSEACLFCHTASPAGEAIDCRRCHGAVEAHVAAAQAGRPVEDLRATIVNPARLSPQRRLEVCLQCHLETTSRALPDALRRFDRAPFSYRPGEPLAAYKLAFDHAPGRGYDDKFEVNHAGYRFLQSRCYRESQGTLTCTTCHNPHRAPRGEAAVRQYREACRSCHPASHRPQEDCAGCHMPKRRTEDAPHVAMTEHRISKLPPAPAATPPTYAGEVVLFPLPDLPPDAGLYRALAQVKDGADLQAGIPALQKALVQHPEAAPEFWLELGEACARAGQHPQAAQYYREAIRREAGLGRSYSRLGETLLRLGDVAGALAVLALRSDDSDAAAVLGVAYGQAGRLDDSVAVLRRAVRANPDAPMAWLNLGVSLEQQGDRRAAADAYRAAIRVQPDFARAHQHLANLSAR